MPEHDRQRKRIIEHPWDGDIVNRHDGVEHSDALIVEVVGSAPAGSTVIVNGVEASTSGDRFTCRVPLKAAKNRIAAVVDRHGTRTEDGVTVLWDRMSRPRYRLSVDDNIEFLKELALHQGEYRSLFDHWYLAFWRRMHDRFGTVVHLNIYYQTVDRDFSLRQMPDAWRNEWEENSDWLHLSFHALQDQPDRIYKDATYERMAADHALVVGEITRFAGESVLSSATTVHWAEAPREACRALRDQGIRVLMGIFRREFEGQCTTGYYLPDAVKDHVNARDYYYDAELDLAFVTEDATINSLTLGEIVPWLDRQAASPHTSELIELMVHEQYFRRGSPYYQPDIQERVVRCLEWVASRGYVPAFWGDGLLGNPLAGWP